MCLTLTENDYRAEYCPDYGVAYCDCTFEPTACEGKKDCTELE
jgi:hypothetical protein